jgi:hypothetical protein
MRLALFGCLLLGGCGNANLKGHYWNLSLDGSEDDCTGAAANYKEKLEYRVMIEGNEVALAVEQDEFATGNVNGCSISYESVIWEEVRGDFEIRWKIYGSAVINVGGGQSCQPLNGTDWDGTEVFEVISSDDPEISPGCEYSMSLSGKYIEEVK